MEKCSFNSNWLSDRKFSDWPSAFDTDKKRFFCKSCKQSFIIGSSEVKALNIHMSSQKHANCHGSVINSKSIMNFATLNSSKSKDNDKNIGASSSSSVTPPVCQPTLRVCDTDVLLSEILWTLHVILSHSSARSSVNMGDLFKVMFPGHLAAEKFKCSRTKLGYLSAFGIASAIKWKS